MADPPEKRLVELEREQWHRTCRGNLIAFCIQVLAAVSQMPARHHRLLCEHLERLVNGTLGKAKLMILAPPGSSKTTYTSRLFPSWYFATRPNSSIIAVSHTASLAITNSGHVRRYIGDHAEVLAYSLLNDAGDDWSTSNGCEYHARGALQAVRGLRADLIILDDPITDKAAAESEASRTTLSNYYHSDLMSRLKPDGKVVLIATPLHERDLMGELLREEPDEWYILRMPAIAEADDALGRQEGEPLWTDDEQYGYGRKLLQLYEQHERTGRLRDWFAQYQGRPRPPEGALFKVGRMPILEAVPARTLASVRAWDFASSTKASADWTVGLKLARLYGRGGAYDDMWAVVDVVRMRGTPDEVRRLVRTVAEADGYQTGIWIPQDPAQAGVDQAESYIRMLSGFAVKAERVSGDKVTRADGAASQANIGRISVLRAPWTPALIEELAAFPSGQHDDQVDALSLAFSKLDDDPLLRWARLSA
jgi:predicted phage terminase large subunit-like protein